MIMKFSSVLCIGLVFVFNINNQSKKLWKTSLEQLRVFDFGFYDPTTRKSTQRKRCRKYFLGDDCCITYWRIVVGSLWNIEG